MAYVLTGVEQGASLSDNNVARNHILVYRRVSMSLFLEKQRQYAPENFFTPRRLPGEPP